MLEDNPQFYHQDRVHICTKSVVQFTDLLIQANSSVKLEILKAFQLKPHYQVNQLICTAPNQYIIRFKTRIFSQSSTQTTALRVRVNIRKFQCPQSLKDLLIIRKEESWLGKGTIYQVIHNECFIAIKFSGKLIFYKQNAYVSYL